MINDCLNRDGSKMPLSEITARFLKLTVLENLDLCFITFFRWPDTFYMYLTHLGCTFTILFSVCIYKLILKYPSD